MSDFLLVFKTLYKNSHARQIDLNGKKRMSSVMTFVLSSIPLIIFICAGLVFFVMGINDLKLLNGMMGIVLCAGQMAVLFLSISNVLNTLYSSRDVAMLNSLPLNQSSIFLAKLLIVYLDILSLTTTIMLPGLLTIAITYNVVNGYIFYGFYPFILLIVLVAPLLPLFLITLFSMPLNYIGTFFKGRSNLKSIFSLIIYVLLIGAYMVLVYYLNTSGFGQNGAIEIGESSANSIVLFSKVMYPNYVLTAFALGIDFGKNFGISIGITIGMIIVLLLLSKLFYKKINQKQLESHSSESHKENISYKQNNIVKALIIRDYKMIFRNTYITLTSFSNIILCPIFLVVMYFINNTKNDANPMPQSMFDMMFIGFFVMFSMIYLCGTNMTAGMAYSREGEAFYITKNLPIRAKDSILAKVLVSLIPVLITILIDAIIGIFLYKIDILSILVLSICLIIASCGAICLHIYYDMKKGSIHWKTNQDLKQVSSANSGTMLSIFSMMIPGILMFGLGFLLTSFESQLGMVLIKVVYWLVFFVLSLIIAIIGILVLVKKGESCFSQIGENKFVQSKRVRNKTPKGMLG